MDRLIKKEFDFSLDDPLEMTPLIPPSDSPFNLHDFCEKDSICRFCDKPVFHIFIFCSEECTQAFDQNCLNQWRNYIVSNRFLHSKSIMKSSLLQPYDTAGLVMTLLEHNTAKDALNDDIFRESSTDSLNLIIGQKDLDFRLFIKMWNSIFGNNFYDTFYLIFIHTDVKPTF